MALVGAIVIAGSEFSPLVEVLDVHQLKTATRLTSKTLFDMVKLSFGVVAGAGTLGALGSWLIASSVSMRTAPGTSHLRPAGQPIATANAAAGAAAALT
ncbi:hypothetical protein ABT009_24785 [Streptomyces sp. NPDC002896]|uniref:hypothetical protein n=1 Tax=Streptomyces sp. NPDC002896 TaxID=3154438 RepID=UPI003318C2EC